MKTCKYKDREYTIRSQSLDGIYSVIKDVETGQLRTVKTSSLVTK